MNKIRTIFFGTPDFAASALEAILRNPRFHVVAVITQPDRPTGRKKTLTPPPVKVMAQKNGIAVLQPEKLKDQSVQDEILAVKPELAIVVAYGNLIPKRLLESVPRGFVNIHPSLLPKHRGATPITATILSGDAEAGVCLMVLDEAMDHGAIIACRKIHLNGDETTSSLRAKLAPLGAEMLGAELVDYLDGKIIPQEQDHAAASFCKQLESADARISWSKPAAEIDRLIRAMHGVTPAWTTLEGETLLIHKASIKIREGYESAGTIIDIDKKPAVACGEGYMIIEDVQLSGGKIMSGQAFLNGHQNALDKILI
jgi:methionyl-tRNA formyltransferase